MALVVTCPACQKRLQVPDELIGQNVQCPECRGTFVAQGDTPTVALTNLPSKAPAPSKPAWEQPAEKEKRPSRRHAYDDEDVHFEDNFDDDEDYDDRPRRRRRSRRMGLSRGYQAPHRGGMILAFGIIALVGTFTFGIPGIIFGPMAWIMGGNDLQEMRMGRMDASGEGMTQTGRVLGIITTCLFLLMFVMCCFFGLLDAGRHR